jgi:hypothetical protein
MRRLCGPVTKNWRNFQLRCSGLQAARHCFDGLQWVPGIFRVQQMENASPVFYRTSYGQSSSQPPAHLRTNGNRGHHKDWLRGPGYAADTTESPGAAFKNMRAARNMLQQRAVIHGKTGWENVTAANGLKSTARPAKAAVHRCLPDFAASSATRLALPQMRNCNGTA